MPLPTGAKYINGYVYITPARGVLDSTGQYYIEFNPPPPLPAEAAAAKLGKSQSTMTYQALPLEQYALTWITNNGDYILANGDIVLTGFGTLPFGNVAGYWVNQSINNPPLTAPDEILSTAIPPGETDNVAYQRYANIIYLAKQQASGNDSVLIIQAHPFGAERTASNISPASGLPPGFYWVSGTINVTTLPPQDSPDFTNFQKQAFGQIDIPAGSYMDPAGNVFAPNGYIFYAGTFKDIALSKTSGVFLSSVPLPTETDPQKEQQDFYKYIQEALGHGFQLAFGPNALPDLELKLEKIIRENSRFGDPAPSPVQGWQCRIGGSLFFVPPVNISVNQTFESGSLTGSAIRQVSSPKFNSGHSETSVTMTLYFPGIEQIWGYQGDKINLNFDTAPPGQIDTFLASLRGLIAQFRYTPFVPIVNEYLNSVWNISSVGFRNMSLSTVPGYPFLIRCDLELVRFNHQVYLPMVAALDDAIDWGRFRQYVGRAAIRMDEQANQAFALESTNTSPTQGAALFQGNGQLDQSGGAADINGTDTVLNKAIQQDIATASEGAAVQSASAIQFFFPTHDPAEYLGPTGQNLYGFDQTTNTEGLGGYEGWQNIVQAFKLGDPNNGYISYDPTQVVDPNNPNTWGPDLQQIININTGSIQADLNFVQQYFSSFENIVSALTDQSQFKKYAAAALQATYGDPTPNSGAWEVAMRNIEGAWYYHIWENIVNGNNFLSQLFAIQNYLRGTVEIDEWNVPMSRLPLDNNFIVEQVRVNLGNNIVRLQLQMLDQPAYQHIGGLDTSISITATCIGEENLTKIRNMFDTINSLARLEHSHAVLGFLGIRNLIVALAGTRYVIPKSYNVETIPGYPHVYRVELMFLDFDVFQQKRELLSTAQENQFVQIMSKRNPFLRLQQVWTAFSAYSDFPLAVRDPDNGAILGYLDPDYYFNAYQTIDDDVIQRYADTPSYDNNVKLITGTDTKPDTSIPPQLQNKPAVTNPQPIGTSKNSDYQMTWHFGPLSDSGTHQSIGMTGGGGLDLRSGDNIYVQGAKFDEAHAGNTQNTPIVKATPGQQYDATAASGYIFPNFGINPAPSYDIKTGVINSEQTGVNNGTASAPAPYVNHNGGSSMGNFQGMLHDLQYRDVSGRMIRAFPTYMLWFIDEGGLFAGIQLFGDFYGLQSVIDFSHVANQDVMGDTLVIRISNLYSRLSTDYQEQVDPAIFPQVAALLNPTLNIVRNLGTGLDPYAVANISTINLAPGARLHLRVGYGSNPNLLDTIFNGVITEVQQGDILTITAQSDAVELGALVNTTNPNGNSGHIDGSLTSGFYLSEPRDLIVRLLSMGGSNFEELISYATKGMLFSQSRFGIRHFGRVLYDPLTDREHSLTNGYMGKLGSISTMANNWLANNQNSSGGGGSGLGGSGTGIINPTIGSIAMQLWSNLSADRSYEIYKRNVYPGNGIGVANYMGGDLGDGGIYTAFAAPGINPDSASYYTAPSSTLQQIQGAQQGAIAQTEVNPANPPSQTDGQKASSSDSFLTKMAGGAFAAAAGPFGSLTHYISDPIGSANLNSPSLHPIWTWLGLTPTVKDDVPSNSYIPLVGTYGPFAEVAFRAETYQKTVWDLFTTCAKLLPNYIIAVRPFMERSTVFYGKPHWAWTSGVIPITYGADPGNSSGPQMTPVDPKLQNSINMITQLQLAFNQSTKRPADIYQQIENILQPGLSGAVSATTSNSSSSSGATTDSAVTVGGDPNSNTVTLTAAVTSNNGTGTASGSGGSAAFEISSLSLTSSSGALIPHRSGGSGIEMHLPTSSDLQTDINQHKQLASLPLGFRHPYYMDRVGGPAGGYAGENTTPTTEQQVLTTTVLSGDSATAAGKPAAFGVLDPDSEQWYISMEWFSENSGVPQNYPDAWKGTRIMVFNPTTQLGCICTPGDYGPAAWVTTSTGRVSGISPDVWQALGSPPENGVLWYGFVGAASQLGPVQWQTGMTFMGKQLPVGANPIDTTLLNSDGTNVSSTGTGSTGDITLDATSGTGVTPLLPADLPAPLGEVWDSSLSTWVESSGGNQPTYLDLARMVYGSSKSDTEAVEIYKEFLQQFIQGVGSVSQPTVNYQNSVLYKIFTGQRQLGNHNMLGDLTLASYTTDSTGLPIAELDHDFLQVVDDFYQWMKNNPYNMGWVILTASVKISNVTVGLSMVGDVFGALPFNVIDAAGVAFDSLFGNSGKQLGSESSFSSIQAIVNDVSSWISGQPSATLENWDLSMTEKLFAVYITLGQGQDTGNVADATNRTGGAIEWMLANAIPGGQAFTPFADVVISDIGNVAKHLAGIWNDLKTAVAVGFSIITDVLRFSMSLINMGVSLSGFSGQQANLLNSVLNDSYYYDPSLGVGSLLWQVDNCFTREYGEPVIEVREPFQRVHYINSFQHILANGLIETMNNVYTVVTASANGKAPHTAWFDKGAPSQYQYEKVVDTGLYLDSPKWYSFFLHPSEVIRDVAKHLNNSDDGTEASRFARAELAKSLKGIYAGEIMVLGDASIRPFDLLYLSDSYERIYGLCEVQQVVHHFTPETGFVTAITPAAIVTVNDPERWEAGSILQRQMAIQDLRNQIRLHTGITNSASGAQGLSQSIDINTLIQQKEAALQGSQQFAGGASAILKDIGGMASMQSLTGTVAASAGIAGLAAGTAGLAAVGATLFAGWEAFSWVRDNLLDAHGCYIQYLNRNGSPMDSGLSYNQGVAVGQLHVYTGLRDILGINIPFSQDGSPLIQTTQLLQNLGWSQQDAGSLKKNLNYWTAQTRGQISTFYAPASSLTVPSGEYIWAEVVVEDVIDPITLSIKIVQTSPNGGFPNLNRFRLEYLAAPGTPTSTNNPALALFNPLTAPSAEAYLSDLFLSGPNAGINADCVIRVDKSIPTVAGDSSTLNGVLFYKVAPSVVAPPPTAFNPTTTTSDKVNTLISYANSNPAIGWQDAQHDGSPYTLNWEMVTTNHASISANLLLPTGQGAATSILNFQSASGR